MGSIPVRVTNKPAPHSRCRFIVVPSVEPGGGVAMGSHLPRRAASATRDDGKGQDIRRQRNTRTNSEDNKAPHLRCRFIVVPSVEPGGGAAMGSHLPRRAASATRDDGKGQDIRRQRNTRTNSEDNKAPRMGCRFIVVPSVEPGGEAAMGSYVPRRAAEKRKYNLIYLIVCDTIPLKNKATLYFSSTNTSWNIFRNPI